MMYTTLFNCDRAMYKTIADEIITLLNRAN